MPVYGFIVGVLALLLTLARADAQDVNQSLRSPSTSAAASRSVERSQSISGSAYTVLGRLFLGEGGNTSYLRFLNLSGDTATVNVTLIGSPSGHDYGTTQVSVPNHASRQISITTLMQDAGMVGLVTPDTRLAAYLQSASDPVAIQHVLYNGTTGFFENMSNCQNSSLSDGNSALINVHTTLISEYTSYISIHNFGIAAATYDIDAYDSETGDGLGTTPVTVEPNETFEQPFSYFQNLLSISPGQTLRHVNVLAFPRSGVRTAVIAHTVFNTRLAAYLNLTNYCTVESTLSGLPIANNDNIPVPSGTQPFTIPFAMLTANDGNAGSATLIDVSQPQTDGAANGTLTQSGNDLTYTASSDGFATFEYRLRNALGESRIATVTLSIGRAIGNGSNPVTPVSTYSLTVSQIVIASATGTGGGSGLVTSSAQPGISCGATAASGTCGTTFNAGTTVTLTAAPNSGSTFLGWGGACSGTGATCNVAMSSDRTVTATFGVVDYALTVVKTGTGSVTSSRTGISCGSSCSANFSSGTTVTLTATPASGMNRDFRGWSGCSSTSGENATVCNIFMNSNKSVTASF